MVVNSIGYPDSITAGLDLSRWAIHAGGKRYSFVGNADFKPTISGVGTRRVNIAAGWAGGKGVVVENTATIAIDLPAPSGSSQWFAIVLRRWVSDGGGGYLTQVDYVAGTASRAIPTLEQTAGTDDMQLIALARVTSADTQVQNLDDLRLISFEGAGFYVCHNSLATSQLEDVPGAEVYRTDNKVFYKRIADTAGVLSWKNLSDPDTTLVGTGATEEVDPDWARQEGTQIVRNGNLRSLNYVVRKVGSQLVANNQGRIGGDALLGRLHAADRPTGTIAAAAYVENDGGVKFNASAFITSGYIWFTSTEANVGIRFITVTATWSVS